MPAYFDLNLQFLRKDLYPGFMTDFDAHLERDCYPYDDGSRVVELTKGRPGLLLLEEKRP